jgi:hypothetical protein
VGKSERRGLQSGIALICTVGRGERPGCLVPLGWTKGVSLEHIAESGAAAAEVKGQEDGAAQTSHAVRDSACSFIWRWLLF